MTLFERGHLPSFAGAAEWFNSGPLGPVGLGGRPDEASAAAGRYMAEAKGIVAAPEGGR